MSKEKIVLFLGAGFSRDVGLPTMAGFGRESIRSFDGMNKHAGFGPNSRLAADILLERRREKRRRGAEGEGSDP